VIINTLSDFLIRITFIPTFIFLQINRKRILVLNLTSKCLFLSLPFNRQPL